jgi:hypothetical protein
MKRVLAALAILALSGCALKTQTLQLGSPVTDRVVGTLKPVVIEDVTDSRDFQKIPENDGPRLDPKIAQQLGAEGRAKAISGMPRGPLVTLLDHGTVADKMREVVAATLRSRGYEVVPAEQAPPEAPRVSVRVKEFWSYMPFSFGRSLTWTMQLKAWVSTDIAIKSAGLEREFTIDGYGAHIVQVYDKENIQQAYDIALADYTTKLEAKLSGSL